VQPHPVSYPVSFNCPSVVIDTRRVNGKVFQFCMPLIESTILSHDDFYVQKMIVIFGLVTEQLCDVIWLVEL